MHVFLGYGCLVSMNQPRLVQDFTARFFVKISLRRLVFVKAFMPIFMDMWMLTSSCPFLTPIVSPQPVRIVDYDEILARGLAV